MIWNPWFWGPLALFLVLSGLRMFIACTSFDKEGSMPKDSFDIVSGQILTIDTLGALLAVGTAVWGGQRSYPPGVIAVVSGLAIMMGFSALVGYYLKAMVPRFRRAGDEEYQFPSPFYPCVKAVFVSANISVLLAVFLFPIFLISTPSQSNVESGNTDSRLEREGESPPPKKQDGG